VPGSSPSLPATSGRTAPDSGRTYGILGEQSLCEEKAPVLLAFGRDAYDFYLMRSTVLRI